MRLAMPIDHPASEASGEARAAIDLSGAKGESGFTLIELLVVLALIAGLVAFLLGGLNGGGKSASLQSAQAEVANLVAAARIKAMASGQSVRVLMNIDPNSALETARYLRYLVVQRQAAGVWQTVAEVYLPRGVYVLPGNFASIPAGLFPAGSGSNWVRGDGTTALRSTVFRTNLITSEAVNATAMEQWVSFSLSATGSTGQAGDIVVASGRPRPPGSYAAGESPVELENPDTVRGVTMSSYGAMALINDRASF